MELIELCVTLEGTQLEDVTYEDVSIKELLDFLAQEQISNSTLDEADNDLKEIKYQALEQIDDKNEAIELEKEYDEIIEAFGSIVNEEVFIQNFKIENNKIYIDIK